VFCAVNLPQIYLYQAKNRLGPATQTYRSVAIRDQRQAQKEAADKNQAIHTRLLPASNTKYTTHTTSSPAAQSSSRASGEQHCRRHSSFQSISVIELNSSELIRQLSRPLFLPEGQRHTSCLLRHKPATDIR